MIEGVRGLADVDGLIVSLVVIGFHEFALDVLVHVGDLAVCFQGLLSGVST